MKSILFHRPDLINKSECNTGLLIISNCWCIKKTTKPNLRPRTTRLINAEKNNTDQLDSVAIQGELSGEYRASGQLSQLRTIGTILKNEKYPNELSDID